MQTHIAQNKNQENQLSDNTFTHRQDGSTSTMQLKNDSLESKTQGKLQELTKNSSKTQSLAQLQSIVNSTATKQHSIIQKHANNTGLPNNLKSGIENLSGISMDDVKVHYNSSRPAQLQAHAYAQGSNIHVAPGQEKHLAHEAWHVVQQKQGRVKPTTQLQGLNINDNVGLEREADRMGNKALQMKSATPIQKKCAKCGGTCKCGNKKIEDPISLLKKKVVQKKLVNPPSSVIQLAPCGDDDIEWYAGTRGQITNNLRRQSGPAGAQMDIAPDLAHIICCAFCESMIRSWVEGGNGAFGNYLRYTQLFEPLVHQYDAQTPIHGGGTRNVYTEEAHWIPTTPALFAALTGLPLQNAYVMDQAFMNAVQAALAPAFNAAAAGVYPAGLPAAQQGEFDTYRNLPAAIMFAVPAGGTRRSYTSNFIRNRGTYTTLRWLSMAPGGGGGTAWDALKALDGRMRVLDFAGDRTLPGGAARHTVADAKFSYLQGGFDNWGAGQAGDQQTIYQQLSGGAPGNSVPILTWDACQCSRRQFKQMTMEKEDKDIRKAKRKRRSEDRINYAKKRRTKAEEKVKFINSATRKWVKT